MKLENTIHDLGEFQLALQDKVVFDFVTTNFAHNMPLLGFSKDFCEEFILLFSGGDAIQFRKRFERELLEQYETRFFEDHVTTFFVTHLLKYSIKSRVVLDFGCGSGELARALAKSRADISVIGADIDASPKWNNRSALNNLTFQLIDKQKPWDLFKDKKIDCIFLTWVLHHLSEGDQRSFFVELSRLENPPSTIVILEDSYSNIFTPIFDSANTSSFSDLSDCVKRNIIYVFDWASNRILSSRYSLPIPRTYRSIEEWSSFFSEFDYTVRRVDYLGFPRMRDNSSPQAVIVLDRLEKSGMKRDRAKEEYIDVSENIRHWEKLRFAQLTVFSVLSGALANLIFSSGAELSRRPFFIFSLAGLVIVIVFWTLDERVVKYWKAFRERARTLEGVLGFEQYSRTPKRRLITAHTAVRFLFAATFSFWMFVAISGSIASKMIVNLDPASQNQAAPASTK